MYAFKTSNVRSYVILFLLSLSVSTAKAQTYFQKTYGGTAIETGAVVDLTSDGGYIVGGSTSSFGSGSNDVYLVKLNSSGDTMWTKAVGTAGSETGSWLEQTNDNGYIITGTNGSLYLNKVDASGISVWAKSYGGGSNDGGLCVQQTPGNGYIVAGFTSSFGAGGTDVYLIKTNSSGDTLWTRTFGGSSNDKAYSLDQTADGGYIICGQTNSYGAGGSDVYLLKVNSAGVLQWSKTYGDTLDDEARSIAQTTDNGYIITGTTTSFGSGFEEIYTIKTDSLGVVQWSKTYGESDGNDRGNSIIQTSDGGYVMTGSSSSFGAASIFAYMVKVDATGTLAWPFPELKVFGGNAGSDIGNSLRQTPDGGFVFAATTQSFGAGGTDIYLVRTNSVGDSSSVCGIGQVSPQNINAATVEASAATVSGSGATVLTVAAVSKGAGTSVTKLPLGVLITTTGVSCFGDTDGQAIAAASAGFPPYAYSWSVGASTTSINTNLPPGTHFLSMVDSVGCSQVDTFIITEPGDLLLSFTVDTIAGCGGGSNGVITGSLVGGSAPYNYTWSNGASLSNTGDTSHTINGLSPGTYYLTVVDANGCTAIDTIKSGMTFTSGETEATCSNADGKAWVSVTGGDTPYTYLWNDPSAQTTDTAFAVASGVYTVLVTDSNGCTDSTSVTVNTFQGGGVLTIDSIVHILCFGATNGAIYMTITDGPFGSAPYTILWSNGDTTANITGLSSGIYSVEVTDLFGCMTPAVVTVLGPSTALTVTITDSTDITCNGANDGTATLSASGGTAPFTYSWTPSGGSGTVATNLPANTYTATVLDVNGCNAAASVTLSEPAPMVLTTDTVGESCSGGDGKAWVSVSGGLGPYTYLWSDIGMQATDTAFNLTAGPYTVTVTDNNGCSSTALATIVQNGNPPVIVTDSTNNVTCNGGSDGSIYITVSGGTGPYTYSWSPGLQITDDITGIGAGTHTVTATDNVGCAATGIYTITQPSPLSIAVTGTDITCNGAVDGTSNVVASNGTGPYTYLWSSGGTSSSKTGLGSGYSAVTVTDNCGATASDSVDIIDPAGITVVSVDSVDITCNGDADGQITIVATGGTNPLGYSITGGGPFSNTTGLFQNLTAGSYTVVVADANLCQTTWGSITIVEPAAISIDSALAFDVIGCPNDQTGMITITVSGGTAPYLYSIDGGTNYQASGTFNVLGAGSYVVQVMDADSCTQLGATLTINAPPSVVIDNQAFTDITCNGANDGTITITASGGQTSLTYSIDNGVTEFPTGTFTSLPGGTYIIRVMDSLCFVFGDTFVITDPPGITISSENKTDIDCFGNADGTITVVASGGTSPLSYSFNGIGGPFTNTSGSFTNLSAGTYNIAVQDANGCMQTGGTLNITEPTSAITFSDSVVDVTGCSGNDNGSIYLSGSGGTGTLVYSIDSSTTFDNGSGIFTNLTGGSYTLSVQDDNGCIALGATVWISEPTLLSITVQSQSDPSKGNCDGSITILPTGGTPNYTYLWDDTANQTNSTATDLCGGSFLILLTDANGCTDTLTVVLTAPDNDIFIPTAFSPNGDGENDKFRVRGSMASLTMVIYNRWGEKVFETTNKDAGWDGTINGGHAVSDSYGYYIEITLSDGTTQEYKGDVLLVR